MDTDGNECVTQAEFNQNAGQDVPAFEDVARLDGDATCISKEDLNQLMNSLQGPLAPEEKQVRTVVRVRMCMLHTRLLALTRAH